MNFLDETILIVLGKTERMAKALEDLVDETKRHNTMMAALLAGKCDLKEHSKNEAVDKAARYMWIEEPDDTPELSDIMIPQFPNSVFR